MFDGFSKCYYALILLMELSERIVCHKVKIIFLFSSPNLVQHLIQPPPNLPVQQSPMNSMSNMNNMSNISPAVSITPVSVPNYADVSNFQLFFLYYFLNGG